MVSSSRFVAICSSLLFAAACTPAAPPNDAMTDAGADTSDSGSCTSLDLTAAPTIAVMQSMATRPVPAGGTVQDGTYVLVDSTLYSPNMDAGVAIPALRKAMIRIQGSQVEWESDYTARVTSYRGTFGPVGTELSFSLTCPTGIGLPRYAYTATATDLRLFLVGGSVFEMHFQKQ